MALSQGHVRTLDGLRGVAILLDTREQPGALRTFWVRRALRILPLYYAFLAFCLFGLPRISVT